ncbi:ABC transporter permease subunit [Chengkuizengella marina]|uniref:ABC-2 type transport system permease protein n=1 Tax=Chengkuizengella marina TaxID=2507566 RepID=A0A6N9Q6D3_9BACL|nr:ABC transporter permease subunit [Chengkuizengella marina]NBI30402.1 hypothetical protein [Chengkuizengella marina]
MKTNLIRNELFLNRRSFLISGAVILLFSAMFAGMADMYLSNELMVELLKTMPQGLLDAFGMDAELMTTFEGWMAGEPFMFTVLLLGAFSGIWAASSISKEKDQQTGEFLFTLPYSRTSIFLHKVLAQFIQITIISIVNLLIVLLFGALFSDIDSVKTIMLLMLGAYFISLAFAGVGYAITSILSSERAAISLGVGIVLVSFLLNMLSSLNEELNWMADFSLFSVFETKQIVLESSLTMPGILITLGIYFVGIILGNIIFVRRDITM